MKTDRLILVLASIAVVSVPQAWAASGAGAQGSSDRAFVQKVYRASLGELDLGKMAMRNGPSSSIRDAGAMMVEDHERINRQLEGFAHRYGISLSMDPAGEDWVAMQDLRSTSGQNYRKDFINTMLQDHIAAIGAFEDEARDANDPALANFCRRTLPTLRDHLKMIENLQHAG